MTDLKTLENRVTKLEERLEKLEGSTTPPAYTDDKILMEALYRKARELVVNHNKASVIFLQRKLLIDFERASRLLDELQRNGVIGPASGAQPRKVLAET